VTGELNAIQESLAACGIEDILVVAPAGCGKTEALAGRAGSLIRRSVVTAPHKILALTFSNKAKANLATRFRKSLGTSWGSHVDVMNLHGFSARIIRAHGESIGLDPEMELPEKVWYARAQRHVGVTHKNSGSFDAAMRFAKAGAVDDATVMERLEEHGNELALKFQRQIIEDNRLDFHDLLRHAQRLLRVPAVRELYRAHFAVVMVDEIQDLSWDQFEIVNAVGEGRTTYAGDRAQGIYTFAGAEPDRVFEAAYSKSPRVFELNQSYRSSPAVIEAVNALARKMGATELECANPECWRGGGTVALLVSNHPDDEARTIVERAVAILAVNPLLSVALIVRRGSRLSSIVTEVRDRDLSFEDWTVPTHVPRVVELLHRFVAEAHATGGAETEKLEVLKARCLDNIDEADVDLVGEMIAACEMLLELVGEGMSVRDAVRTCKRTRDIDAPVRPGLHLLNGHLGKGQEFDWVAVVGFEDGHIPDFRAQVQADIEEELRVLHVMASRAKTGLVLSRCEQSVTQYGPRPASQCRWWPLVESVATEVW
jgi:DNA helicase-2/ATP-dependent DNA helicase PcrA